MKYKYINIPRNLVCDKNIPASAKILYGQIKILSYKTGKCLATNSFLADMNDCSNRTITELIRILKVNNYIRVENTARREISILE